MNLTDFLPSRHRKFSRGDTFVLQGYETPFIASIKSGSVNMTKTMKDGRLQTVGMLFPTSVIGDPERSIAICSVTAMSELEIYCFDKMKVSRLIRSSPVVAAKFLEARLSELDDARDWMLLLGRRTARERVAALILYLYKQSLPASAMAKMSRMEFELFLSRGDVADCLGLSMETVSRCMTSLHREDLISLDDSKKITINDAEELYIASGRWPS